MSNWPNKMPSYGFLAILDEHKNIYVTNISYSLSKKAVQANEEVSFIDDLYTNNFKAVTDTQNVY